MAALHTPRMQEVEPFRFYALPAELRNLIYEKTFEDTSIRLPAERWHPDTKKYEPPGILLASKQIYAEAVKIFHHTTTFYLNHFEDGVQWYMHLPLATRRAITCLRYDGVYFLKGLEREPCASKVYRVGRLVGIRWTADAMCEERRVDPEFRRVLQTSIEIDLGKVIWANHWDDVGEGSLRGESPNDRTGPLILTTR